MTFRRLPLSCGWTVRGDLGEEGFYIDDLLQGIKNKGSGFKSPNHGLRKTSYSRVSESRSYMPERTLLHQVTPPSVGTRVLPVRCLCVALCLIYARPLAHVHLPSASAPPMPFPWHPPHCHISYLHVPQRLPITRRDPASRTPAAGPRQIRHRHAPLAQIRSLLVPW